MTQFSGYAWAMARFVQAILLGALAFAFLPIDIVAADERTCLINKILGGDVQIASGGVDRLASKGLELLSQETIRTGPDSRAEVLCSDGVRVTIGTNTRLSIGNLPGASDQDTDILMRVISGIAGFIAPDRTWRSFRVQGHSAIASVRSTDWLVESSAESTAIFVRKGTVAVEAADNAADTLNKLATLTEGEGIDVSSRNGAGEIKVWGEGRLSKVFRRLGLAWGN